MPDLPKRGHLTTNKFPLNKLTLPKRRSILPIYWMVQKI